MLVFLFFITASIALQSADETEKCLIFFERVSRQTLREQADFSKNGKVVNPLAIQLNSLQCFAGKEAITKDQLQAELVFLRDEDARTSLMADLVRGWFSDLAERVPAGVDNVFRRLIEQQQHGGTWPPR